MQCKMDDLVKLVTQFVCDWREFARCMNFLESEIRVIETHSKLQLSTEYASHFMKLFLDRKQDVTSWSFWCNLLNKFDNGRFCVDTMKKSDKLILKEDDLSNCHFKLISQKVLDWRRFARVSGHNEEDIEKAQENFKTAKERNEYLMKMKLNNENSTWEFWKENLEMFGEGRICIQEIENENVVFVFNGCTYVDSTDLISTLSNHIKDWKELARLINFDKFEIEHVENSFANIEERCLYLMNKFINGEQDITSWIFWRNLLSKYKEGKLIIYEVEKAKIEFFQQGSQTADHRYVKHCTGVISHQYDCFHNLEPLEVDHEKEIPVNVSAGRIKMLSYEKYNDWIKTKKDYYGRFSLFQQLTCFDFTESLSQCEILQNFQEILKEMNNKSFAVKGYSVKNHYSLFGKTAVMKEDSRQTLFIYLENENIFLNINICEKDENISESIHKSLESYQYFQAIHEDIQASNSIFIGIVAFDDAIVNFKEFCSTCVENHLFISKNILKDKNALKSWIIDMTNSETVAGIKNQLQGDEMDIQNGSIGSVVKRDILTFQALQQDEYPSFAKSGPAQTMELKKLLLLTPIQIAILLTKSKYIVITGGYGSGKSLALLKKFLQILSQSRSLLSISKDIFYLICHDRQSKFLNQMELYKKKYLNEVTKLASMMDQLKDSYIVVANQSLQINIESNDIGFNYKELEAKAKFSWFPMDSSMRCAVQINNFIKETTCYLESLTAERTVKNTYHSSIAPVDIEYALEHVPEKRFGGNKEESIYNYNQPDRIGHNVLCENVNLYAIDTSKMQQFYSIYLILDKILSANNDEKFAICLYVESLYNSVCGMMKYLCDDWTNDIQEFLQTSRKRILITDYASIRGYEFENFIFIVNMNQKYMKFRYVECFSRATTSLFVIADTAGLTEDCDESKLLAIWQNCDSASHFKMDYKAETDEYLLFSQAEKETIVLVKKNLKLREETVMDSADVNSDSSSDKYPWKNIHYDDISENLDSLYNPFKVDDVDTFLSNFKTYQMDFITVLEDDEGLIYKLENFKGMDPVKIVEHFYNVEALSGDIDIDGELVIFGSLLHMAICNDALKSTEFLLRKGYRLDFRGSETESNIQLPLSSKMIMLLEKYGLKKQSILGKRWLGVACFFDDTIFFEYVLQANQLNAKTHKICDWYPLLRLALYHKAMKIGELLINKYKVDINEQDIKYQKTVLHQAAITNKIEFAELVLAHGADILIKDRHGNTPYQYAGSVMKNVLDSYQPTMALAPDLD